MADESGPSASASASAAGSGTLNVDISTPAVVQCGSSDAMLAFTFDAEHLHSTHDAFFKLRLTVTLKAAPSTNTPLYIFINPERIKTLEVVEVQAAEPETISSSAEACKKLRSPNVFALRFILKRPVDLVGPKFVDWTPRTRASGAILDSLRSLARHESFTVYFPQKALSQARLKSLCEAASNGTLKPSLHHADLSRLYQGKGGQTMTEPETAVPASPLPHSPPSYDELGPGPPQAPISRSGESSKKRRRRSSSEETSDVLTPMDIERMCRRIVDEQQSKLYDRVVADLKTYVSEELVTLEYRIRDHVAERLGKQAEEQDAHLEQRLDEVDDTIESRVHDVDEKVEDEFYGLRLRLEEFIEEEVVGLEERIVEQVQNSASVSLEFNL